MADCLAEGGVFTSGLSVYGWKSVLLIGEEKGALSVYRGSRCIHNIISYDKDEEKLEYAMPNGRVVQISAKDVPSSWSLLFVAHWQQCQAWSDFMNGVYRFCLVSFSVRHAVYIILLNVDSDALMTI